MSSAMHYVLSATGPIAEPVSKLSGLRRVKIMMGAMGRVRAAVLAIAGTVSLWAAPASAQPADAGKVYLGALVGAQSVQKVGALAGVEVGYPVSDRLMVQGELTWLQNTVTRRRIGTAESVATFLQQTQGGTATAALDAPAVFAGGGVRWFLTTERSLRPYLIAEVGLARVTFRPTFTLKGSDVTALLPQYGVTLGSDLADSTTKPALSGGFGVATTRSVWRISADLRVTSIRSVDQPTNVLRVNLGIGRDF